MVVVTFGSKRLLAVPAALLTFWTPNDGAVHVHAWAVAVLVDQICFIRTAGATVSSATICDGDLAHDAHELGILFQALLATGYSIVLQRFSFVQQLDPSRVSGSCFVCCIAPQLSDTQDTFANRVCGKVERISGAAVFQDQDVGNLRVVCLCAGGVTGKMGEVWVVLRSRRINDIFRSEVVVVFLADYRSTTAMGMAGEWRGVATGEVATPGRHGEEGQKRYDAGNKYFRGEVWGQRLRNQTR